MSAILNFIKEELQRSNQAEVPLAKILHGVKLSRTEIENEIADLVNKGVITYRKTKFTTNYKTKQNEL